MSTGRIELIECAHVDTSPGVSTADLVKVLGRWWYSEERGLTCDSPRHVEVFFRCGILAIDSCLHDRIDKVFPSDGRRFFDSLPYAGGTYSPISRPIQVDVQGGEPIKTPTWFRRPRRRPQTIRNGARIGRSAGCAFPHSGETSRPISE